MFIFLSFHAFTDGEPIVAPLGLPVGGRDLLITGVAVSWEDRDAYFIALTPENVESKYW